MVIAGAGGHAKEILSRIINSNYEYVFDDTSTELDSYFNNFKRISNVDDLSHIFMTDPDFILAIGNPQKRYILCTKMKQAGGKLASYISPTSSVSTKALLEEGLNIMDGTMILANANIGEGCLINTLASIHHDVIIGRYCEVGPGARVLGGVQIGNYSFIGANATILPGIKIGQNVLLGAGSVVTKDIQDNSVIWGNPAIWQRQNELFTL